LQTNNIKNSFRLGFKNDKMPWTFVMSKWFLSIVSTFFMRNEVSWNEDSSQLLISKQCFVKSPIYTISFKLCDSSPTCLQTYSSKCIMLFTSFQIFQEPRSTWASMPIQLQTSSVENPFRKWRTWL
jgi:hypothetical protein